MDIKKRMKWVASLSELERESMQLQMRSQEDKVQSKIGRFVWRLKAIGINVELMGNYPWVYLHAVNGIHVKEKYWGNHGFTILFQTHTEAKFTDRRRVFAKVREVLNANERTPVYQDDLLGVVHDVMESIDKLKGHAWSDQTESDAVFDEILGVLEREFNYPDIENHN
ncbi:MAG: hypothetical protein COB22_05370 [Cycloclasticus sp.]|nr:MAG: hypothetical protein COB22_05370 [Cycloclasticus sp.]